MLKLCICWVKQTKKQSCVQEQHQDHVSQEPEVSSIMSSIKRKGKISCSLVWNGFILWYSTPSVYRRGTNLSTSVPVVCGTHWSPALLFWDGPSMRDQQCHLVCSQPVKNKKPSGDVLLLFQEVHSKSKVCANVFCGAGRECAVNEKGEPSCLCIEVRTCRLLLRKLLVVFFFFINYALFDSCFVFFLSSELQAPQEVSVRQQQQDLQEPLWAPQGRLSDGTEDPGGPWWTLPGYEQRQHQWQKKHCRAFVCF